MKLELNCIFLINHVFEANFQKCDFLAFLSYIVFARQNPRADSKVNRVKHLVTLYEHIISILD